MTTYVYGFIRPDDEASLPTEGIGGPPYLLESSGIAAVVGPVEFSEIDATRRNLLSHSKVLDELTAQVLVLPVRFGVIVESDDEVLRRILEPNRERLEKLFVDLDGHAEVSVQAIYHEEPLLREVVNSDKVVRKLVAETKSKPEDATYFQRVELGERVAKDVQSLRDRDSARVIESLRPLARDVSMGEVSTEHMVVHASFLVESSRLGAFDDAVEALNQELGTRMRFRYLGPLPPYSFVDLGLPAGV